MKRPDQDVAGRPRVRPGSRAVAGRPVASNVVDVAEYRQMRRERRQREDRRQLTDPMSTTADDAHLLEEFMDFLSDDVDENAAVHSVPDPKFQQRLRSRLWRNYVLAYLKNGEGPH